MKHLVLIVHAGLKVAMTDFLRSLDAVSSFTLTEVEGHGAQADEDATLSVRDKVVGYVPQLRVDILVQDAELDVVLDALQKNESGLNTNPSRYWVMALEKYGELQT